MTTTEWRSPSAIPPRPESALQALGLPSGCRILIVDDEAMVCASLARLLLNAGAERVETTTESSTALGLFEDLGPDLVLLDLHMPGIDGMELLRHLRLTRPELPSIPIVVLTGDGDERKKVGALTAGASDFLLKPLNVHEVLLRVRALLLTRVLQQELAEQNRTLEARVVARTAELESSQLEMLECLAAAAELHDDETGQHTQRVGQLAGRLAHRLGLTPVDVELIRRAAPLHDLGKIGVPDAIMLKPGKLTPAEFEQMKLHAANGARILSSGRSPLTRIATGIARHHHERWDGAGYPDRLIGATIPLEARIVAVADFFDALTHDRPYRLAVPVAQTLGMIQDGSGSHFDPAVASAFLALCQESGGEGWTAATGPDAGIPGE